MRAMLAVFCSLLVACASGDPTSRALTAKRLAGEWYRGDGLGYNVTLTLTRDSSYDAIWTGCLGTYGTAHGHWKLDQFTIILTPTEEEGIMLNYLRTLDVVPNKRSFVLVPSAERKQFDKRGADYSYGCFSRSN